ncbi:ankyrin repeat-containing domain protein [Kockovaella imperatae]|uniref:Ankyrin repeat-containing domain protein n=1 Tax=Kockovaella imperatae TaxID=4999 RepID=A0A1Y1UN05_9TREE|nr:ankyrin repeat-containing domain protein [Kockovaella imperatae]ORX38897.1 ankyrin repeat-containing domain protein [Kockovaella imperatae]
MTRDDSYNIGKAFKAASEWLSGTPAAAHLPNERKLELYGLFKYIQSGIGPAGSRPSLFSPAPRAKYDAWVVQHARYSVEGLEGVAKAQERYMSIAREVGWDGHVPVDEDNDEDLEHLDSEDEEDHAGKRSSTSTGEVRGKSSNTGMGTGVSMMSREEMEVDGARDLYPLHEAVLTNDLDTIKALLDQSPELIDVKDDTGNTALHLAVDRGYIAIVEFLLMRHADLSVQDEDGQTPLDIATMLDRTEIIMLLQVKA